MKRLDRIVVMIALSMLMACTPIGMETERTPTLPILTATQAATVSSLTATATVGPSAIPLLTETPTITPSPEQSPTDTPAPSATTGHALPEGVITRANVEQVKLLRQLGPTTVTAQGISGAVPSPDGRTLAVYDVYEERFELWDATTSQVIMILETNVGLSPLYSVIFSPDGQMLASFSRNFVQTWDSATGQLIQSFPIAEPGRTYGIAFRPDGVLVASTGDHLQLWDVASGKTIVDLGENISPPSYEFVFHPTHPDILAWERNQDVQVWNIATGELIQTIVPFDHCWPFECEPYGPARLAFSPDGQRLVILYTDGVLETWDWKNGQGQQSGGGRGAYPSLAFSPLAETQLLVTSATHYADGNQDIDGHISFRVYSEASGTYEFVGETIVLEDQEVMSVAFSPDGRYVYAAVRDAETALTPIGGRVYVFGVGP